MEKKLLDPNAYDCCTIYVVTDGLENCSKIFTKQRIKQMVQTAETKYNIKVIYLAANQDAILEAGSLGIDANQAINYSESRVETGAAYRGAAAMIARHRSGEPVQFLPAERSASQRTPSSPPSSLNPILFNIGSAPPSAMPPPLLRQSDYSRRVRPRNES